uniref:Uncharacterized protein n=1 Tax=Megaselia scalaris TaxID=36166 RepID=T1GEW7_MEGSC
MDGLRLFNLNLRNFSFKTHKFPINIFDETKSTYLTKPSDSGDLSELEQSKIIQITGEIPVPANIFRFFKEKIIDDFITNLY